LIGVDGLGLLPVSDWVDGLIGVDGLELAMSRGLFTYLQSQF
jgi:hypothetical protein